MFCFSYVSFFIIIFVLNCYFCIFASLFVYFVFGLVCFLYKSPVRKNNSVINCVFKGLNFSKTLSFVRISLIFGFYFKDVFPQNVNYVSIPRLTKSVSCFLEVFKYLSINVLFLKTSIQISSMQVLRLTELIPGETPQNSPSLCYTKSI